MELEICVWEHELPESPQPWFRLEVGGVVYQGQAAHPPTAEPDGRVRYRLTLSPLEPRKLREVK